MKGIGYKEIIGFLAGEYDIAEAIRLVKQNTRKYAKRQLTWFTHQAKGYWLAVDEKPTHGITENIYEKAVEKNFL